MRADIDEVERVELDTAEEVTGTDHVDLMGAARLDVDRCRVRDILGHVAGLAPPGTAQPGLSQHPFDRAGRRDRVHAEPAQLPLHRK